MKNVIGLVMILGSLNAMADGQQTNGGVNNGNGNNINNCNPTLKCEPKVIYSTDKQKQRIKELEAELAKVKSKDALQISALRKENLELQKEVAIIHEHVIVYKQKDEKIVKEQVEPNKNALSLIGVEARTGLTSTQSGSEVDVKHSYQASPGLMYQRDISDIRASVGATMNKTFILGIGLSF